MQKKDRPGGKMIRRFGEEKNCFEDDSAGSNGPRNMQRFERRRNTKRKRRRRKKITRKIEKEGEGEDDTNFRNLSSIDCISF